jgi:UDP-2-acetamido-3-amino-2,3-dideoxy-glucuronate N-acetyltransferase
VSRDDEIFVHPSSVVDEGAVVGRGTRIWHFCHVSSTARVGERCVLGQNVYVGPAVDVGDGAKIQNNVSLYEGVILEEDVFLGPSCVFTNVLTPRAFVERKDEFLPTRVSRGASVGANATILAGVTIGEYAMVGAGSVVTRDVEPYTLVMGNPARPVGRVSAQGARTSSP